MLYSELLEEKYRVQKKLAEKYTTIKEYLEQSRLAAAEVEKSHGILLRYTELPKNVMHLTRFSATPQRDKTASSSRQDGHRRHA